MMKHFYDENILKNSWLYKLLIGLAVAISITIFILLLIELFTTEALNLNMVLISLGSVSIGLTIGLILPFLFKTLRD